MQSQSQQVVKRKTVIQTAKRLCRGFCLSKRKYTSRDMKLYWALQTRAQVVFTSYTVQRIFQAFSQQGGWFRNDPDCSLLDASADLRNCLYEYNKEVVNVAEGVGRQILYILIAVSAVLCIFSFKWRMLANSFMYLECLIRIDMGLVPNTASQSLSVLQITMISMITTLCFFNDSRGHLAAVTILQVYQLFFVYHVVYLQPMTTMALVQEVFATVIFIAGALACALAFVYVIELHARLEFTNVENSRLLDGMHEGLCILQKDAQTGNVEASQPCRVLFCNLTARKILIPQAKSQEKSPDELLALDEIKFAPILQDRRQVSQRQQIFTQTSAPMSLYQIILAQQDEPDQKNCVYSIEVNAPKR